jgi:hypothetical protein
MTPGRNMGTPYLFRIRMESGLPRSPPDVLSLLPYCLSRIAFHEAVFQKRCLAPLIRHGLMPPQAIRGTPHVCRFRIEYGETMKQGSCRGPFGASGADHGAVVDLLRGDLRVRLSVSRTVRDGSEGDRGASGPVAIDNARRFVHSSQVGAYFGFVPCQDASAGSNRLGHITKQGPGTARKYLVEAAWQGVHRSPTIRAYFERLLHGRKERRKIALVATAHYLVRCIHAILVSGRPWREAA